MPASLTPHDDLLTLTAQIVSAQVRGNKVEAEALPALIQSVYGTLAKAGTPEPEPVAQTPAVPIKKSIQQDALICLEDGARVKLLRPYIAKRYGLTPDAYRRKWGLSSDYPMVAPAYATRRSELAKELGLGRKPEEKLADLEADLDAIRAKKRKKKAAA